MSRLSRRDFLRSGSSIALGVLAVSAVSGKPKMPVVSIISFSRRIGDNDWIDCSGATTSASSTVTLTEHTDDLPQVFSPSNVVPGGPTWSCSFNVGNYGVGSRTFTLYVANTEYDLAQMTKVL